MWKRLLSISGLLLLAACNLNITPDGSSQTITGVPLVQIVSPLPNATYLENVTVNIQALVSNAGPDIDRVEFSLDDTVLASVASPNEAGVPSFSTLQTWQAAGTGAHSITVIAYRSDGSSSEPASVGITVVGQVGQTQADQSDATDTSSDDSSDSSTDSSDDDATDDSGSQQIAQPTPTVTNTPRPTNSPEPEATNTPAKPMATFLTGVNVRSGPSTLFNPPLGGYAANDQAEIVAVNSARTWYKIKYYNAEGWVHADLMSVSGNAGSLPVDEGPPIPTLTPVPPTPVPATATPNIQVNLVAGNITSNPSDRTCGETFRIFVDVANFGSDRSPGGTLNIIDTSNGLETRTTGAFGEIDPGKTVNVGPIPLTVSTNFSVEHTLTVVIDPSNAIAETNEGDNQGSVKYTLKKGGC